MDPEIVRFGNPLRTMVGALTLPDRAQPRIGFVLCRPFGGEAIRSNAFFRTLAMRLAREGCAVLSFDYYGTGESPGEGAGQSFQSWQQDILNADAYLRRRTGVTRCHWFGLALGATLAARAAVAARADGRPAHLVLWEPVENGRAYGASMCARHRREMERWFRARWNVIRRDFAEPEPALPGVVLGFEVGDALAADLDRLDGLPFATLLDAGVALTIGRAAADSSHAAHAAPVAPAAAAAQAMPQSFRLRTIAIEQPVDWMTNHASDGEEYRGSAIVPQDAILAARESLHAAGSVVS